MDMIGEFPGSGKFFRAADLMGVRMPLTVRGVEKREMRDGEVKPCVTFEEDPRVLVLNDENRFGLIDRFGRESEHWVGKRIVLVARPCRGPNGQATHGIRFEDESLAELLGEEAMPPAKPQRNFTKTSV